MSLDKRKIVESTIDSIAKGIIKIQKSAPEAELLIHYCQYYLDILEVIEDNHKWDMNKIDHAIDEIMHLLVDCRVFNYLDGITQDISEMEPMKYCLNKKLILQRK